MAKKEKDEKDISAKGPEETTKAAQQPPSPQPQGAGPAPDGIKINEEGAFTTRSDYFAGSLALTEALLAFGRVKRDGSREVKIDAKVVVSVRDAKRILMALQQLIRQYEDKYGAINI